MSLRYRVNVVVLLVFLAAIAFFWPPVLWSLLVIVPLIAVGVYDYFQRGHTILRNFPLIGRIRWFMEHLRPYIRQYLLESDTDGRPINRMFRSLVYQRAKNAMETIPFGTRVDTYASGYEWIGHSLSAIHVDEVNDLRVTVGGPQCTQPYSASIFNVSGMSYGALSGNALLALNRGARDGNFAHNTGEGGISPFHLRHGGDLIWQIGTGYFGCREADGGFSREKYREQARMDSVRMIEIKLSQGAKPGHGGILPAAKNYPEIARIRGVEPWTEVESPAAHTAFRTPLEMIHFIDELRELSGGKPVGFKICVGRKSEFISICKAIVETGIYPDFISVDGGEGGTGAAPLEYTNSVGMPMREGLAFVTDCLSGFGIREHIHVIASGKIFTGFHMVRSLALGADICSGARSMMLALGCVHSLVCNTNRCPTGVTTQDPRLERGLVVEDKAQRVTRFHNRMVHATADLLASAGLHHSNQLNRTDVYRRVSQSEVCRYDQLYPYLETGCLLSEEDVPEGFTLSLREASPEQFEPGHQLARHGSGRGGIIETSHADA